MKKVRDALAWRLRIARRWIRDGTPLWQWLAVAIVLFGLPYVFPVAHFGVSANLADRVRWSGMLFQFAGLATVVWGLNRSRQLFDRSSLWKAIGQWLGRVRYIVRPPKAMTVTATGLSAGAATVSGTGAVLSVTSGGTLEERVARLEHDAKRIEAKLSDIDRDIRKLRSETNEHIERERRDWQASDRTISEQLETATIGGIHLEVAGLVFLFVGIAFATMPREIAWLVQATGL